MIWGGLVVGNLSASDHDHLLLGEAAREEATSTNSAPSGENKFVFRGFAFNQRPRLCLGVTVFLTSQANLQRER